MGKTPIQKDALGFGKASDLISKLFAERIAKQEAKAKRIQTESEFEIIELEEQYALKRLARHELHKQQNMDAIAKKAKSELPPNTDINQFRIPDNDWTTYFIKHCDSVSDKEMQSLWAKILAGEVSKNRSFSRKTISIVSQMDTADAQLFTDFCQFVWFERSKEEEAPYPLIYDDTNSLYTNKGVDFSALKHLDAMGLISYAQPNYAVWYSRNRAGWNYHKSVVNLENITLDSKRQKYFLSSGTASLTQAGEQLLAISKPQRNEEFFQYVLKKWETKGYQPSLVQGPQTTS